MIRRFYLCSLNIATHADIQYIDTCKLNTFHTLLLKLVHSEYVKPLAVGLLSLCISLCGEAKWGLCKLNTFLFPAAERNDARLSP